MRWPNLKNIARRDPRPTAPVVDEDDISARPPAAPCVPPPDHGTDTPPPADDGRHASQLSPHLALGRRGELLAAEHLARRGYRLVASNFKIGVGRNRRGAPVQAEIDIVAYDGPTLCFVEVKTRASDRFAAPEANVDLRKQRQITRAARAYRRLFDLHAAPFRYDVLAVVLPPPGPHGPTPPPRLQLLKNFWTDDKFHKRRWTH